MAIAMRTVRILKNWSWPDITHQTPGSRCVWGDTQFVIDIPGEADYVCVANHVAQEVLVKCPPEHVWLVVQEPPNEISRYMHLGAPFYGRVFHQDPEIISPVHQFSHGALPWSVGKSYDELSSMGCVEKGKTVSWITSNSTVTAGHRARMGFLDRLRSTVSFDLWGRGFSPIADKWDGLAPYKYSIAIENFVNAGYWSEKIIDPLLAWAMPIYCGCTEIEDYLPAESMFRFSIDDPEACPKIKNFLEEDLWSSRLDAIAEARWRILNEHQLFPFLSNAINSFEQIHGQSDERKWLSIYHPVWGKGGVRTRLRRFAKRGLSRIRSGMGLNPFG